jgi:Tfp pilus assembly protein PilV
MKKQTRRRPVPVRRRTGAAVLVAMICLLVVSMLGASLLKVASVQRQQLRQSQRRLQAQWLAESGLERASARLRANLDYAGETWTLTAKQIDGRHAGRVQIDIQSSPAGPQRRVVSIVADYPHGRDYRASVLKRAEVDL